MISIKKKNNNVLTSNGLATAQNIRGKHRQKRIDDRGKY